jgi:hypothetical protein
MVLMKQFVLGLVLVMGLVLVVWLERVKGTARERAHYLDLRKDSRLAQERSLAALGQKEEDTARLRTQSTDVPNHGQNES